MSLTFQKIYKAFTTQSWSLFESDTNSQDDLEDEVVNSLQTAFTDLWNCYDYQFKRKSREIVTTIGTYQYSKPVGMIDKVSMIDSDTGEEKELPYDSTLATPYKEEKPDKYFIKFNKINLSQIPDANYTIVVEYFNSRPVMASDGTPKYNFEYLTDYLDIPTEYEDLFLKALVTKAMSIHPYPKSDINAAYVEKAQQAYNNLINISDGTTRGKHVTW